MKMNKIFIKNRNGQKISVVVEQPEESPKGLAFVMHGLGGFKEQPHIQTMAEVFLENGYCSVRFDTANTIGESNGRMEDANITNYYEDLSDVITWTKKQSWYTEPFILAGHSLGGISTILYAENFPEQVRALAPASTVISGRLTVEKELKNYPEKFAQWEKTGIQETPSLSKPGVVKRLNWFQYKADALKYNVLPKADKLIMPVLMVVGSEDRGTPLEQQRMLFEKLSGPKELHIIKGSRHTFWEPEHLQELKQIFDQWIKKLHFLDSRPKN